MMWAMPVAYLGPEGTFSEAALRAVDPGAEPLSCPTIQAALALAVILARLRAPAEHVPADEPGLA